MTFGPIKVRRGGKSVPESTCELWIFWEGKWEQRSTMYGNCMMPSVVAGYQYYDHDKLEVRVADDYDGPLPDGFEYIGASDKASNRNKGE